MTRTMSPTPTLAAAILCISPAAHAAPVEIRADRDNSQSGLGDFTGLLTYTPLAPTAGSLLVTLTNTSSAASGGFLTAFAFNVNSPDPRRRAMLFFGPHNWTGHMEIDAGPFGSGYDGGAASADGPAPFNGGGDPRRGLGVGETGVFDFMIFADDAGELSAEDFALGGPAEFNFVVRFRGFEGEGSDMTPAEVGLMPLPSAAAMSAVALLALAARRRRGGP